MHVVCLFGPIHIRHKAKRPKNTISKLLISSYRDFWYTSRQIEVMYGYKSWLSSNETESRRSRTCNTDVYRTIFKNGEKINVCTSDKTDIRMTIRIHIHNFWQRSEKKLRVWVVRHIHAQQCSPKTYISVPTKLFDAIHERKGEGLDSEGARWKSRPTSLLSPTSLSNLLPPSFHQRPTSYL